MINKETKLFISAAQSPGNFGATIYNKLFNIYNINAVYLPRKIINEKKLIGAIKTLDIKGCSVTMPLKSKVVKHLNKLDEIAKKTGSVNTIVNNDGILCGYNADYYGALDVILSLCPQSVLIYGAGSVTNSVILALQDSSCKNISIIARRATKAKELSEKFNIECIDKVQSVNQRFDLLINATPASIENDHELFLLLPYVDAVFDLVVSPTRTELIIRAQNKGLKTIEGIEMSKRQLKKQFEIYTGIKCEIDIIDDIVNSFYKSSTT